MISGMLAEKTEATKQALDGLRDLSMIEWYAITLLALVFYIYAVEIKKAQQTGNWNAVAAGLALFGMDLINEIWNGLVLEFTNESACWTTPGDTAYRIMVGWNLEIAFMFSIAGIVFAYMLPDDKDWKIDSRLVKLPNRWAYAVAMSAFCVFVEVILNAGDVLVWHYWFWEATPVGIWLIFFIGYLPFYVMAFFVHDLEKIENKIKVLAVIYAIGISGVAVFMFGLGWI
ncbi:MAG: hypothetical protein ACFFGZ_14475 [Candidatus Thorarchaeota archaeon]